MTGKDHWNPFQPSKGKGRNAAPYFPSDYMTEYQQARMNGPVRTYRMAADVTRKERENWPEDLQKLWEKRFGGGQDEVHP